jgi:hypothetical protein
MLRNVRRVRKTITFDGTTGKGAQGLVPVFGVANGAIRVESLALYCRTDLAGASATLTLGVPGAASGLIASTTATDLDAGEVWSDTTPDAGVGAAIVDKVVAGNINITVGTADVTAGVLDVIMDFVDLTPGVVVS